MKRQQQPFTSVVIAVVTENACGNHKTVMLAGDYSIKLKNDMKMEKLLLYNEFNRLIFVYTQTSFILSLLLRYRCTGK